MHLDTFIPAALLFLLATSLSVVLFKYLGLGSVLGLLAAGIAIGPHSPGPRITENIADIRHFAELGVVSLLFLIGLEMRPSRLWSMRREVFGLLTPLLVRAAGLIAAGATDAVPDVIESSLCLASLALQQVNVAADDVDVLMQGIRDSRYELAPEKSMLRESGGEHQ